jgi:beta-galactosidase
MKTTLYRLVCLLVLILGGISAFAGSQRDRSFDSDWRFLRADAPGAEVPEFNDSTWRKLDVPHDWSIEDLPAADASAPDQSATNRVGPFDRSQSKGGASTGYVVGGTAWYRKHFKLASADAKKLVAVRFDGVYMNADFWINGHLLGNHPYGYTSFEFDLTPYLNPAGRENVLAVRVRNDGKNSRWYSGSGIYRHAWLTFTEPVHVPTWGVFVTTPEISKEKAVVKIATEVCNASLTGADVVVRARVLDAKGKTVKTTETKLQLPANETRPVEQTLEVVSPKLWSLDAPNLYSAEVEIVAASKTVDEVSTPFGIRKIEIDAEHGFRLNGEMLKLKGGCVHHDNGPLGSAAIDRAEERRVELLKANGYNAIRTSHNPPSPAFLDACDRLGMLVVDEAFDCWDRAKNPQDYHLYFKDWSDRDIASMVRRDRNHPSVVIWSIGNEIPEQFGTNATAKRLREAVLSHDATRPITQAICNDWGQVTRNWDTLSDPAFVSLDVAGYNYLPNHYESDHVRHPERVIMGTESYPKDFFDYWALVEKHPYVIGDFTWTAMDYLGESGIGHSLTGSGRDPFFMSWPWFNAWCGDIDICGFKKPQSFYRDVVWGRSQIEMAVHAPIPEGQRERVSGWGWPDEAQSWNWPGQEGKPLQVAVYSRCNTVRLELNGKVIGEKPVSAATKLTAKFDVPYAPGELRAVGLVNGKAVANTALKTSGAPRKLKLIADREKIRADRNDLSYVTVEIVDAAGQRVPDAEIPVRFSVTGAGELAAQGSSSPNTPASFRAPIRKTFEGRCLAILRPLGSREKIQLKAEADGLGSSQITVTTR